VNSNAKIVQPTVYSHDGSLFNTSQSMKQTAALENEYSIFSQYTQDDWLYKYSLP
jgi:hypothetical protein